MAFFADLHGHLHMWKYKGNFDDVVDLSLKRLNNDGAIAVDGFAMDIIEPYKNLISKPSEKYGKEDIDGRATLVTDKDNPERRFFIFNGSEELSDIGHMVLVGYKQGTPIPSDKKRHWKEIVELAIKNDAAIFAPHPFHIWGAGNYFMENPEDLKFVHGIEINNADAYLPIPPTKALANKKAREFFKEIHHEHPNLGGLSFQDNHALYELGRNATKMLGKLEPNRLMPSLLEGIASCTPERMDEHKYSVLFGLIAGTHHLFDNVIEQTSIKFPSLMFLRKYR